MWEDLLNVGSGLVESIGEGATQVIDSVIDLEVTQYQEAAKDPEVLKAAEPVKGTATDGSTIVGTTTTNGTPVTTPTTVMGFDKQTLMIGGGVLTAIVLAVVLVGRRR